MDLKRVVAQYLLNHKAVKAVVAPFTKREQLEQLGFEASLNWLMTAPQLPHQLEEAILGLIAGMDKPGSPAGEAISACYALLHKRSPAFRTQLRAQILAVTLDDLKKKGRKGE